MGCGRRSGRCASGDSVSSPFRSTVAPCSCGRLVADIWCWSRARPSSPRRAHRWHRRRRQSRPRREAPRLCPQAAAGRGPPVWEARAPGRPLAQATLAARRWPLPARSRAPWPRRRPQPAMPRLQLAAALLLLCGSLTAPRAQ
ncbi:unnamed protein product, partial [Prorocentrum cordatum]